MYSFETVEPVFVGNFRKGFTVIKHTFDLQNEAAIAYAAIAGSNEAHKLLSSPDAIGFGSVAEINSYINGNIPVEGDHYSRMMID